MDTASRQGYGGGAPPHADPEVRRPDPDSGNACEVRGGAPSSTSRNACESSPPSAVAKRPSPALPLSAAASSRQIRRCSAQPYPRITAASRICVHDGGSAIDRARLGGSGSTCAPVATVVPRRWRGQWRSRTTLGPRWAHRFLFYLFCFINGGGYLSASVNQLFIVTLAVRRTEKPPQKTSFAGHRKNYCSSEQNYNMLF